MDLAYADGGTTRHVVTPGQPLVAHEHDAGVLVLGDAEQGAHVLGAEQPRLVHPDHSPLDLFLRRPVRQEPRHSLGVLETLLPQHAPRRLRRRREHVDTRSAALDLFGGGFEERRLSGASRTANEDHPVGRVQDVPHGVRLVAVQLGGGESLAACGQGLARPAAVPREGEQRRFFG